MTEGFTSPTTVSSVGAGEVRAEEITELVERLHRREERISVNDVAETLGVEPEAVEATLRAIRSERMPPVVTAQKVPSDRRRRFRMLALAPVTLLVGFAIFNIGLKSGARSFSSPGDSAYAISASDGLAEDLREALPAGMSVTVGKVTYTGSKGQRYADESRMASLIEALIEREATDRPGMGGQSTDGIEKVVQQLRGGQPVANPGVAMIDLKVASGQALLELKFPKLTGSLEETFTLTEAVRESREEAARAAANRLSEWAELAKQRR